MRGIYFTRFSGIDCLIKAGREAKYIEVFFKEIKKRTISFEKRSFTIGNSGNLSKECQSMNPVITCLGSVNLY